MSWEYQGKEKALNFSRGNRPLSEEIVTAILNFLRLKNNRPPVGRLDDPTPEFDALLDVGCGSGARIGSFTPYFKSTIGIDASEILLDLAKKNNNSKEITYLVGLAEDMPVSDESIDLATFICSALFMDMKKAELELNRVLKPNGVAAIYGYVVDGIDLLENDSSREVLHQELSDTVANLWKNCLQIFIDHANKIDHPDRHNFNKFGELYEDLQVLEKSRVELKTNGYMSLEQFIYMFDGAIPFYESAMKTLDFNPIQKFREDVKKLWNILDVDDKDVIVKVKKSSYIIFLVKQR